MNNNFVFNATSIDFSKLSERAMNQITAMSNALYQAPPDKVTIQSIINLLNVDLCSIPVEFTISAGSTRRTEIQYCSNNYHASEKIDCSYYQDTIRQQLSQIATIEEQINTFIDMKHLFMSTMEKKIANNEHFIRDIIRQAEVKDGIEAQGRFK